jgi:RIO kinase 1
VQITGTEVLLEFIDDADGIAAPRLAETRPDEPELSDLWDQLLTALVTLARGLRAADPEKLAGLLVKKARLALPGRLAIDGVPGPGREGPGPGSLVRPAVG